MQTPLLIRSPYLKEDSNHVKKMENFEAGLRLKSEDSLEITESRITQSRVKRRLTGVRRQIFFVKCLFLHIALN